jgi:hypothetical protein
MKGLEEFVESVEREAISFCSARNCCSNTLVLASISMSALTTASLPAPYMSYASRMSIQPRTIGVCVYPKMPVFCTAASSYNGSHRICPLKNDGPTVAGERLPKISDTNSSHAGANISQILSAS